MKRLLKLLVLRVRTKVVPDNNSYYAPKTRSRDKFRNPVPSESHSDADTRSSRK